jgi:hypothetical protein
MYGVMRTLQIRRLRIPKPQVQRGDHKKDKNNKQR